MGLPALSFVTPHKVVDALAHHAPWGCQHSHPLCPHPQWAVNALVHYVCNVHLRRAVASPHDWQLIIRAPPGSLPPPQSPHIVRPREKKSTACVEIRMMWMASSSSMPNQWAMLNAMQTLPSDAALWFPHDAPASTPPTHPHSHLWCHCCPCLLKSHLRRAWTLPCDSPTMLASMCVDGGSGMPERWWRVTRWPPNERAQGWLQHRPPSRGSWHHSLG